MPAAFGNSWGKPRSPYPSANLLICLKVRRRDGWIKLELLPGLQTLPPAPPQLSGELLEGKKSPSAHVSPHEGAPTAQGTRPRGWAGSCPESGPGLLGPPSPFSNPRSSRPSNIVNTSPSGVEFALGVPLLQKIALGSGAGLNVYCEQSVCP